MSSPTTLKDVYADELKDLWSANDQMAEALSEMSEKIKDAKLKQTLSSSVQGINKHSETIRKLLESAGEEVEKERCKGMEGLVKEAKKHTTREAPEDGALLDLVIVSQYQRMCHYGLAGFGTASAYAEALGLSDDVKTLKSLVGDIYKADEYASTLAEKAAALAPAAA